ncbi:MAG: hypothetical protein WBQ00_20055, partial [Terriglobales bacterium]
MTCDSLRRVVAALALALLFMAFVAAQSPFPIYAHQLNANQRVTLTSKPATTAKAADFARAVSYSTGGYYASSVAIADLDGDGEP